MAPNSDLLRFVDLFVDLEMYSLINEKILVAPTHAVDGGNVGPLGVPNHCNSLRLKGLRVVQAFVQPRYNTDPLRGSSLYLRGFPTSSPKP